MKTMRKTNQKFLSLQPSDSLEKYMMAPQKYQVISVSSLVLNATKSIHFLERRRRSQNTLFFILSLTSDRHISKTFKHQTPDSQNPNGIPHCLMSANRQRKAQNKYMYMLHLRSLHQLVGSEQHVYQDYPCAWFRSSRSACIS